MLKRLPVWFYATLVACALLDFPLVAIHGACVLGYGPWSIPGVELLLFPALLAGVVGLAAIPFAACDRSRHYAVPVIAAGLVSSLGFIPAALISWKLRTIGFRLAAERAEPLVAAITAYERSNGRPPESFDELIPQYLPAIPSRLPRLELVAGERANKQFEGNTWALYSVVSTGILNWDQFIYLPLQNYPSTGYGGWLERVHTWAYVHE